MCVVVWSFVFFFVCCFLFMHSRVAIQNFENKIPTAPTKSKFWAQNKKLLLFYFNFHLCFLFLLRHSNQLNLKQIQHQIENRFQKKIRFIFYVFICVLWWGGGRGQGRAFYSGSNFFQVFLCSKLANAVALRCWSPQTRRKPYRNVQEVLKINNDTLEIHTSQYKRAQLTRKIIINNLTSQIFKLWWRRHVKKKNRKPRNWIFVFVSQNKLEQKKKKAFNNFLCFIIFFFDHLFFFLQLSVLSISITSKYIRASSSSVRLKEISL